jgi:hypothetical protein
VPELLAWQVYFLAAVLGLVAWQSPFPAAAGLVLLWWLARPRLPCRAAHLFFLACFGFGLAVYWTVAPGSSAPMPTWMQAREKVEVSGRVVAVETAMDRRLSRAERKCTGGPEQKCTTSQQTKGPRGGPLSSCFRPILSVATHPLRCHLRKTCRERDHVSSCFA